MKDQFQGEGASHRKSSRQRVPNSFYTEGINQLKKAPKHIREQKSYGTKNKNRSSFEDYSDIDQEMMDQQKSQPIKNVNGWYSCRLPTSGKIIKVQFVTGKQYEPAPVKKKQEPVKQLPKAQEKDNLFSLFVKAIENVTDQVAPAKLPEPDYLIPRQPPRKKDVPRKRRGQDMQDRILEIKKQASMIFIKHSKLGEIQVPINQMEPQKTEIDYALVAEYRQKLAMSDCLRNNPLFT